MKLRAALLFAVATLSASLGLAREKPVLEKGMPAEMIIQLVGKPVEVTVIKGGEGRAETWIYRRQLNQTIEQTANTQTTIPAMVGFAASGLTIGQVVVPEYRLKYLRAVQVTALLIYDGRLQLGRQWVEREEEFAD